MAVYTLVSPFELETFLSEYDLGALLDYRGISDGVENTNYGVTTTCGEYVLTLLESIGFDELPYCLELMAFLAGHGVPSAHPLPERRGRYLRTFKGRPAFLARRLQGHSVTDPDMTQCRAIGKTLGRLHMEGQVFPRWRENNRGFSWWGATAKRLLPYMTDTDAALLEEELNFQAKHRPLDLPQGVIHGDLFRDNALFVGSELSGIVDFYYSCNDVLLYDVAITVNDWCTYPDNVLQVDKALALLSAYHQQRPLQPGEREAWPALLRAAALRFWLSRLQDRWFPRLGELTQIKDPGQYQRLLRAHVENYATLYGVWI